MMFERIFESTVVIADITGKNPNFFYELGVSHTAVAKTITIGREDFAELIPFDIAPYRVIIYPTRMGEGSGRNQGNRKRSGKWYTRYSN